MAQGSRTRVYWWSGEVSGHEAALHCLSASGCLCQLLLRPRDSGRLPGNSSWHTLSYKKLNGRAIKYLICLMNECLQILMNSLLWLNEIEGWELSSEYFSKRWVRVVTFCPRFDPQEQLECCRTPTVSCVITHFVCFRILDFAPVVVNKDNCNTSSPLQFMTHYPKDPSSKSLNLGWPSDLYFLICKIRMIMSYLKDYCMWHISNASSLAPSRF